MTDKDRAEFEEARGYADDELHSRISYEDYL